ncbi:MAG: hypothetical protein RL255_336 [Actinomycetota bacterium]
MSNNYLDLPDNLPVPIDDGAAQHLVGMKFPDVEIRSTSNQFINPGKLPGLNVLFCYPMTGVPGVPLPEGWDDIPGARGCTPQACSYRDAYPILKKSVNQIFGISTQDTDYQKELHERLELPYEILSDSQLELQQKLNLPIFEVNGKKLLKRLTMLIRDGKIQEVHYPVFPSNKDVDWVIERIKS